MSVSAGTHERLAKLRQNIAQRRTQDGAVTSNQVSSKSTTPAQDVPEVVSSRVSSKSRTSALASVQNIPNMVASQVSSKPTPALASIPEVMIADQISSKPTAASTPVQKALEIQSKLPDNPVVETLRSTPKRRTSIVIIKKAQAIRLSTNRLKPGEEVQVNENVYKIESSIGSGGSCVVYKSLLTQRSEVNKNIEHVALKVVDLVNTELERIFENEIDFLKKLQHSPFVITMHDHQRVGNKLYVVMELGERNFKEQMKIIKEAGRLDGFTLRFFWTQMLQCVNVIHDLNIVHADLKPANFVLVNSLLKLIDFGIAAQIVANETTVYRKRIQGTLNYISPEAVNCRPDGDGYDIPLKSDVWSLGCILYALVYGEPPFVHVENQEKKILAIRDEPVKFPSRSARNEKVDRNLLNVLKLCLTRDLNERPSVVELLKHPYVL